MVCDYRQKLFAMYVQHNSCFCGKNLFFLPITLARKKALVTFTLDERGNAFPNTHYHHFVSNKTGGILTLFASKLIVHNSTEPPLLFVFNFLYNHSSLDSQVDETVLSHYESTKI